LALPLRLAWRRREGKPIAVLRESEFLSRFAGGSGPAQGGAYTLAHLARELNVPRRRLGTWLGRGWIVPLAVRHGIAFFDFQQVAGLKHLARLLADGVTTQRLAKSLRQLQSWLPQAEHALVQLARLTSDGKLVMRTPAGTLAQPDGQLLLEFDAADTAAIPFQGRQTDEQRAEAALVLETAGRFTDAATVYADLLRRHESDAQLWLNYGNVLYELDQPERAERAYRRAVALEADFAEAWNNLGAVLMDLKQLDEAERALRRSLALRPDYDDANTNLADLLEFQWSLEERSSG
jgi:tetratricopeptide (TPR) repeat protein